jgi:methyl-accepting chemotaxis protein
MILLCWIVGRGIARPIVAVTRAMDALVKGDLDTPIPTDKRRDEIGTMIHVIGVLKESMLEAAQMRAEREAAREISEQEKSAALVAMAERIEADSGDAVGQISKHTTAMTETVERMHALAANTGQSATSAATAAEAALVTAQTVASAAEQLSASVREISVQVAQSTVVVNHAVGAGQNARETIQTLNERVGRIGAVATIIADIAARTNWLALNATIEAARAGDAGKGFAVVAGEVKQLANQTAQSTREITRHVNDVRAATEAAVSAVHGIETTIDEVNQIAGSIASAVEEQGAATAEIARNVAGTAQAINEMTSLNMGVSSEAKQAGEYAKDVLEKTKLMGTSIRELQQTVIRTVRQSAAEVNRRLQLRYETDLPCRLETAGTATADARIADISEGGARVIVARDIPRGTSGTLFVPAMNATLPFQVEASRPNEARLLFPHDEETKTVVLSVISRLPGKLAA